MIEVLKQALEALEYIDNVYMSVPKLGHEAITSLRQAISELEQRSIEELESQEPVAVWELFEDGWDSIADPEWMESLPIGTKLYTHPPQRTEQEPVAWMDADGNVSDNNDHKCFPIPLYTHPPQEQRSCDKRTEQEGKQMIDWYSVEGETRRYGVGMVECAYAIGRDEVVHVVTHESVKDIAMQHLPIQRTWERPWVSLTDEEVEYPYPPAKPPVYATAENTKSVRDGYEMGGYEIKPGYYSEEQLDEFAKAIEAKLKEKNT